MIQDIVIECNKTIFSPRGIRLDFLKNCPEAIPVLVEWVYQEWISYDKQLTKEKLFLSFQSRLQDNAIPFTLIALKNRTPIGTISLKWEKEPELKELLGNDPWLGSLHVAEKERGQGLGEALVSTTKRIAKELGYKNIFFIPPILLM